jgi:hypothetical protein
MIMPKKSVRLSLSTEAVETATAALPTGTALASVVEDALVAYSTGAPAPAADDTAVLDGLAAQIQSHITNQPGGQENVQLYFSNDGWTVGGPKWKCHYVGAINGSRRSWKRSYGNSPLEALQAARAQQVEVPAPAPAPEPEPEVETPGPEVLDTPEMEEPGTEETTPADLTATTDGVDPADLETSDTSA